MRVRTLILCVSVFALTALSVYARDLFFEGESKLLFDLVDRDSGLSNQAVSSVVEDKHGFMWFGTQGGLNRYDGANFRTYRHEPFEDNVLAHNLIQTMAYDAGADVFWLGTYRGLVRFDQKSGEFRHFEDSQSAGELRLSSNLVIAVLPLEDGGVWIGTSAGLDYYDPELQSIRHYHVPGSIVRSLHLDAQGELWIGSNGGLSRFDHQSGEVVAESDPMLSDPVMRIIEGPEGVLELGVWEGGVVRYDPASGETTRTEFPDNRVYTILRTHDDTLWVATWGGGLFAMDAEAKRYSFSYSESGGELAHNVVYSLYQDSRRNLWIGTNGAGVHSVNPNKRDFGYPGIPTLPRGRVQAIHRDQTKRLWIGIYGGGLVAVDQGDSPGSAHPNETTVQYYRHVPDHDFSLANDIVNRIYESPEGQIYIATQGGIQRYRPESNDFEQWGRDFYPDTQLPEKVVYPVTQDYEGRYWIGTYNSGVLRYDPRTGEQISFRHDSDVPGSLSDNLVYDILPRENGSTWIATNNGLCRHDAGTEALVCYQHDSSDPSGLSSSAIRTLFEDRRGRLWIGSSSGGLSQYHAETNTFTHLTERDGLSDNTLTAILEDDVGRLWLATGRGITLYHTEDSHAQALDKQSGLPTMEYNYGRLRDFDGSIIFAGIEGLVRIPADFRVADSDVPQLHITDVLTYTDEPPAARPSHNDRTIELSLGVRTIAFSFAGLNYNAPAAYRYRYRLAGFDDDWVSSDEHGTVSYAALPPGTFRFQVEAIHSVDGSRGALAEVEVIVPEYWWRTFPARVGYALAGLLILFAAVRLRENRVLLSANAELERTNALLEVANLELTRLSIHDPLTGLFNRRYFEEHFASEIVRARREVAPIALLLLDIDHFKNYNDQNGHIAGDRCLQAVSNVLSSVVRRPGDFVARYGGEELLVVLPNTDEQGAEIVAELVHDRIRRSTPVTASIGLCVLVPDRDIGVDVFVARADEALYRAKNDGRDRTRIWRPSS